MLGVSLYVEQVLSPIDTFRHLGHRQHMAHNLPEWTLADRLRKIRRDRHLTQDQMAVALGVKAVTWSSWEAGRNRPGDVVQLANAIENRFGVPAGWTLGILSDRPAPPPRASDNGTVVWGRRTSDRTATAAYARC